MISLAKIQVLGSTLSIAQAHLECGRAQEAKDTLDLCMKFVRRLIKEESDEQDQTYTEARSA